MPSVVEARELISRFEPGSDGEAHKSRELTVMLLEQAEEPFARRHYLPGHVTTTAVVLSPDRRRVLLVYHNRLRRWLLPGGHVESDDWSLADSARREVREETGAVLQPEALAVLAGMDVHGIPAGKGEPFHLHHDLIFSFTAESERCEASEEVREVVWCPVEQLDRYLVPGSIRRSVMRAAQR